ncbi:MAG: glycosyltransferase [Bacteroidetes bacterium]|nr:glycosyltransferase [Bacteroidota bacterium]
MKVTLVNTSDVGGAAVATFRLYHALKKAGVDVKVLLQKAKKPETLQNNDVAVWINNKTRKWKYLIRHYQERQLSGTGKSFSNFSSGQFGVNIANHEFITRADVVHLHWVNDNFIGIKNLAQIQKPIVWTFHDMWPINGGFHYMEDELALQELSKEDLADSRSQLYAKCYLQKAEVYSEIEWMGITPSVWLSKLANQAPLTSNYNVVPIPNPIDIEVYKPGDKASARKRFGISQEAKVILFGSFNVLSDQRKGFAHLKNALDALAKKAPNSKIELAVIGRRNDDMVEQVPFKVHFLGFHSSDADLVECYQVADVFALPSEQDNLPNMCMEALSCGIPVVAFNIGGVPDMVVPNKTGLLSELGHTEQMANNLTQILLDDTLQKEMAEGAREHVVDSYSENAISQQLLLKYSELLNG